MLEIGNLKLETPLLLAPMAGITDHPFRVICKEFGASIVYTEFVSANGIIRENQRTLDLIKFTDDERPIGVQIFGEDPESVSRSALFLKESYNPDIIDINYGCPVPKVTKKGAGSAAMKDLCRMEEITAAVVDSVGNTPVTVKMRAGWDENNIVSVKAGEILEKNGVKAITLHPRTTKQQFRGLSNWEHIKELKQAVSIPIIGNGDVKGYDDYMRMIEETNCDGVMIARAAMGNPWIFRNILYGLKGKLYKEPTLEEKTLLCKKHFILLKDAKNETQCVNLSKKHFGYYLKGFNKASEWRIKFMKAANVNEVETLIDELISYGKNYTD
tara:strand:+ start:150 stop:1133 length:984 start_codon:yes stop_codon:yes gene_type:complete